MGSRRPRSNLVLLLACGATLLALAAGCGGAGSGEASAGAPHRVAYLERVRDAVLRGADADFALGTGIGGPTFEACVEGRLRKALDGPTVANLVAIYRRPDGTAYAAQALNALTAPLAARCGHRSWFPELVEAARGLRSAAPIGASVEKLGVTYGPYLGMRCRHVGYGRCSRVGIDVVFDHAATGVVAVIGCAQTIRLRTPGRHNRIAFRDWVGTFTHPGLPPRRHHQDQALVYVPIELRVRFADGRRAHALFPHVLVSSGWG